MSLSCCVVCTTKLQDRQAAKVGRDDLRLSSKSSCEQKLNMFCLQYLQFMFFFCFLRNSLRNLSLVFVPRSSCDFEVARCFSFFPFDVILAKFLDLFFLFVQRLVICLNAPATRFFDSEKFTSIGEERKKSSRR